MKKVYVFPLLLLFLNCGGKKSDNEQNSADKVYSGEYEQYYNERFGFGCVYPSDLLIPGGESGSGDGQKFISKDEKDELWVYVDFKMNAAYDATPELLEAYELDIKKSECTEKTLYEDQNYYFLAGIADNDRYFRRYTFYYNDNFYVLHFIFLKERANLFDPIVEKVAESFYYSADETYDAIDDPNVEKVVIQFLEHCWYGKNFNALLRDNDMSLKPYIDDAFGIKRYYNPGTNKQIFDRKVQYGFMLESDIDFITVNSAKKLPFYNRTPRNGLCEESFDADGVYVSRVSSIPGVFDVENMKNKEIRLPEGTSKIINVQILKEKWIKKSFYFLNLPSGWKLCFVDDSDCSS